MHSSSHKGIQPPELLIPKSYLFSWGVQAQTGDLLFISGQVSTDINRNVIGIGDIGAQTMQIFKNMELVLKEAGAEFTNVVDLTTYVVGRENLDAHATAVRELFPTLFPNGVYPSNTLILVDGLYREEFLLEIRAVAVLN